MTHEQGGRESGLSSEEVAAAAAREERIAEGLAKAWRTGRPIDDWTAKHIASELDPGSGPLHEFAETGAIPDGIDGDLASAEGVFRDLESEETLHRITALGDYVSKRLIRTEMPYWNDEGME